MMRLKTSVSKPSLDYDALGHVFTRLGARMLLFVIWFEQLSGALSGPPSGGAGADSASAHLKRPPPTAGIPPVPTKMQGTAGSSSVL